MLGAFVNNEPSKKFPSSTAKAWTRNLNQIQMSEIYNDKDESSLGF